MPRFLLRLILALTLLPMAARAETLGGLTPAPPRIGVMIEKLSDGGHVLSSGSGILLNDHLVLTAAHVVQRDPENPRVSIIFSFGRITGQVIRLGQADKLDLALISFDPIVVPTHHFDPGILSVCPNNPGTNQAVVVLSKGMTTRSSTISSAITSDGQAPGWTNMLNTGYHPGNSGGGVFNPQNNCLWGILVLELGGTINGRIVDLSAFVPASQIAPFIHPYMAQ